MNPYLAQAAMLAAGIKGIEEKLELPEPFNGDVYASKDSQSIPSNLYKAIAALENSTML
jgi:glutamine synthetase